MTAPPPRRPWWKRKRTWAAVAIWLAAAYPLSVGPALYGRYSGWLSPLVLALYRPFAAIADDETAMGRVWNAYVGWWLSRGIEQGEANGSFHINRSGID